MLPDLKGKLFEPLTCKPLRPRRREYAYALGALALALLWSTGGDQVDALTQDAIRKDPPPMSFPCTWIRQGNEPARCVNADLTQR